MARLATKAVWGVLTLATAMPLWAQPKSAGAPPVVPISGSFVVAPLAPLQAAGSLPGGPAPQLGGVNFMLEARLQQYATWDAKAVAWALASSRDAVDGPATFAVLRQAVALPAAEAGPLLASAREGFGPAIADGLASLRERILVAAEVNETTRADLRRIAQRGAVEAAAANALLDRAGEVARSLAQTPAPEAEIDVSGAPGAPGRAGATLERAGQERHGEPWSPGAPRWSGKTGEGDAREWVARASHLGIYRGEARLAAIDLVDRFIPILERLRPPIRGVGDWARQEHAEVIADVGDESATIAVFLPGVHLPMAEPLSLGSALQESLSRAGGLVDHGNVSSGGRKGAAAWIKLPRRAQPSGPRGGPWSLLEWVDLAESIALQSRPLRSGGVGVADSRLGRVTSGENGSLLFEMATRRGPLYGPRRWRRFEADRHTGALLSVSEAGMGGGWRKIRASNADRERFNEHAPKWLARRDPATGRLRETAHRDDPDQPLSWLLRIAARAGGFLATGYAAIRALDWIDPWLPSFPGATTAGIVAVGFVTLLVLFVSSLSGKAAATLVRNLWSPYPAAQEERLARIRF